MQQTMLLFNHMSACRSFSKKEQLARTETPRSELGTDSWAEDDEQEVSRCPALAAGRQCTEFSEGLGHLVALSGRF